MPDPTPAEPTPPPPISPTGAPVLPPKAVPYALYAVAIAAAVTMAPDMGIVLFPAVALSGAKFIVLLGTLFGIASPGQRK